jgi:Sulfotransferase domain
MPRRVFILGCHRSGTTMMRLILNSHKDIHCFDEWKSYPAVMTNNYANTKNAPVVGLKMPNWTEWIVESDEYKKYYENDPIIFMFRDVRGVIASALSLPTGKGCFFNGIMEAIDEKWPIDTHRKFYPEYKLEMTNIEKMNEVKFRKAAIYWRYKTSRYLSMVKAGYNVLPIHYELFVRNPISHLKVIMDFIELDWDDNLLNHHMQEHDETNNGYAVGNTLIKRPIDTESIDKWKKVLTEEQEKAILETAGAWNDFISILA